MNSESARFDEKFRKNYRGVTSERTISLRLLLLLFPFLLLITASAGMLTSCDIGSGDDTNQSDDGEVCNADYLVGPEGAVLTIDDPNSPSYGVAVEVAPGELNQCRTFYLADDNLNVSVTPYLSSGFLSGPRRREGVFEIKTSGEPPYDAEITITIPLSDTDLNVGPGEVICAFYFDKIADSWRFVMPQSIDEDAKTMTVVTTYREVWNWGRVDVQKMDRECLEAALKDRMGQSELAQIIADIEEIGNDIENENISFTSCTSLRNLQSGLLDTLRRSAEARLTAARSDIDPLCGICDPLSSQFEDELYVFIDNKMESWFMELLADNTNNIVVELALRLDVLICDLETRSLNCDYSCVYDELGIGFWLDFGEYEFARTLQYMIDWYISLTPGMNC